MMNSNVKDGYLLRSPGDFFDAVCNELCTFLICPYFQECLYDQHKEARVFSQGTLNDLDVDK